MLFSFWKTSWINKQDQGTDRMEKIGKAIADGAMAFLRAEYGFSYFCCSCSRSISFWHLKVNSWLVSYLF